MDFITWICSIYEY